MNDPDGDADMGQRDDPNAGARPRAERGACQRRRAGVHEDRGNVTSRVGKNVVVERHLGGVRTTVVSLHEEEAEVATWVVGAWRDRTVRQVPAVVSTPGEDDLIVVATEEEAVGEVEALTGVVTGEDDLTASATTNNTTIQNHGASD